MLRKITITNKLAPFSHENCVTALIPGSEIYVKVWPCFLTIGRSSGCFTIDQWMKFKLTGPVEGFTVQQEVEKRRIRVCGKANEGYFSYYLYANESSTSYDLVIDRAPKRGIKIEWDNDRNGDSGTKCLQRGDAFFEEEFLNELTPYKFPKLSLGMHKKQQFPELFRRKDPKELFPLILALGYSLPRAEVSTLNQGVLSLVEQERWDLLFQFCFKGLLYPDLHLEGLGEYFHGFTVPNRKNGYDKVSLLSECAHKILSYFLQEKEGKIQILPALPKKLISGRLIHAEIGNFSIDLEWTKNKPRRMIVEALEGGSFHSVFQKGVKGFRLTPLLKQAKGEKMRTNESIEMEKGKRYLFDRFER